MLSWWCRRSTTTTSSRPLTRFQIRTLITEQQPRSVFNKNGWEAVIGIEVHAQINSKTKLFSGKFKNSNKKRRKKTIRAHSQWKTRASWRKKKKENSLFFYNQNYTTLPVFYFIDMETSYEEPPNSKVSMVDLAFPGVQPVKSHLYICIYELSW